MHAVGGKQWFTAAELSELRLPGLSKTKRKINERAAEEQRRPEVDRYHLGADHRAYAHTHAPSGRWHYSHSRCHTHTGTARIRQHRRQELRR